MRPPFLFPVTASFPSASYKIRRAVADINAAADEAEMINAQRRWGPQLGSRVGGRHGPFTLFIGGFFLSEAIIIICVAGAARARPHRILCLLYLVSRGPKPKSVSAKL